MSGASVRYLWRRPGSTMWQARVRAPASAGVGSHIVRSLRTRDRTEALRRLPIVVGEIKKELQRLRRDANGVAKRPAKAKVDPELKDALWWREHIAAAGGNPDRLDVPPALEPDWRYAIEDRLGDPIGEDARGLIYEGEAKADRFASMVQGALPVGSELERYLAEKTFSASYVSLIRLAVRRLEDWLAARPAGNSLAAVDRREASQFVDHLTTLGLSIKTVNQHVAALHGFWKWMERRGSFDGKNPWHLQQRSAKDNGTDAKKRPFTDDEVKELLSGSTYLTLHDLMRVAALSGMRLNEITRLTVGDLQGGVFDVRDAKTKAGVRKVPIHPALGPLIDRRTAGKRPEEFLIEELGASPSRLNRRGSKAGERFTSYRRDLGLDERLDGRRQSNVDFHSFRRWFATKLEQGGIAPHIIAAIMGHEEGRAFLALTDYSAGPSFDQLREAVNKVQLPPGTPTQSPAGPKMGSGARTKGRD